MRVELGGGVGVVHGEARDAGHCQREGSGDCGLDCSAVTNETRLGDGEGSGAARGVR